MSARVVWIIVIVVLLVVAAVVAMIAAFAVTLLKVMDTTDAHACGLAFVKQSPDAARLLGEPIAQDGFTGGNSNNTNGELTERITFNVKGPKGTAFVVSEGKRTPIESHLTVTMGRDQESITVYDGKFDCPELHAGAGR